MERRKVSSYEIITEAGEGCYEEKRSRFLSLACPADTEEEVQRLLGARKKAHPMARHHCYAFAMGAGHEITRFSDDGEPSGTAGAPILEAIKGSGLHNILIIVTRYFGGTLLGTGGLARAYSASALDALAHAKRGTLYYGGLWHISLSYSDYARLDRWLRQEDIPRLSEAFTHQVTLDLLLLPENEDPFQKALADLSAGKALPERVRDVVFLREKEKITLKE